MTAPIHPPPPIKISTSLLQSPKIYFQPLPPTYKNVHPPPPTSHPPVKNVHPPTITQSIPSPTPNPPLKNVHLPKTYLYLPPNSSIENVLSLPFTQNIPTPTHLLNLSTQPHPPKTYLQPAPPTHEKCHTKYPSTYPQPPKIYLHPSLPNDKKFSPSSTVIKEGTSILKYGQ